MARIHFLIPVPRNNRQYCPQMPCGLSSSKFIWFFAKVTELKEEANVETQVEVCLCYSYVYDTWASSTLCKKKEKKSLFFSPQTFLSSKELLNKMIYFTWLIIGILLIYPRADILNHIFFSIEGNEMIFISWHDWLSGSWSQKSIRVQSIAPTSW